MRRRHCDICYLLQAKYVSFPSGPDSLQEKWMERLALTPDQTRAKLELFRSQQLQGKRIIWCSLHFPPPSQQVLSQSGFRKLNPLPIDVSIFLIFFCTFSSASACDSRTYYFHRRSSFCSFSVFCIRGKRIVELHPSPLRITLMFVEKRHFPKEPKFAMERQWKSTIRTS